MSTADKSAGRLNLGILQNIEKKIKHWKMLRAMQGSLRSSNAYQGRFQE